MKINYLCNSWQFLLQQLVYQISKGYYYYHVGTIPMNKASKCKQIDEKIIRKYNIDLSKYQRSRKKVKGLANFYYLRWRNIFIILHTEGDFEKELILNDEFKDIRDKKKKLDRLQIRISDNISFEISLKHKTGQTDRAVTISFDRASMQNLNTELSELVQYKKLNEIEKFFTRLSGIPAWSGITQQKAVLLGNLYKYAKEYGLNTKKQTLIKSKKYFDEKKLKYPYNLNTRRKIYDSKYTNDNIQDWL